MKKKYLKTGLFSGFLGLVALAYSYFGSSYSADSLDVANASTKTMGYIFAIGIVFILIGIVMLSLFFAGKSEQ